MKHSYKPQSSLNLA